jgi:hypothetical protein
MISNVAEPPKEATEQNPVDLWKRFTDHIVTLSGEESPALIEDIVTVYLLSSNPIFRGLASQSIGSLIATYASRQIYYRLAASSRAEPAIATWACINYLACEDCTASELEALLTMNHLIGRQRDIATRLLKCENISLNAFKIIERTASCKHLMAGYHQLQMQELYDRQHHIDRFLEQTDAH